MAAFFARDAPGSGERPAVFLLQRPVPVSPREATDPFGLS